MNAPFKEYDPLNFFLEEWMTPQAVVHPHVSHHGLHPLWFLTLLHGLDSRLPRLNPMSDRLNTN